MNKLLVALVGIAVAFGSTMAIADDNTNMATTPAEQAKLNAERAEAKAKWDKMTPEEKSAVVKSARSKKLADLNAMERFGQENDMMMETQKETADAKAARMAAKAKWDAMTPAEKAAVKKTAMQKKRDELTVLEKAGPGS